MVYCIFIDGKMAGYAMLPYKSASEKEVVVPMPGADLIEVAGEGWQARYSDIALVNNDLVFTPGDDDETN